MNHFKYIRLALPVVLGFIVLSQTCYTTDKIQTQDPVPGFTWINRQWIWPLLLVLIGASWELSLHGTNKATVDLGFSILLAAVCWWFWLWCSVEQSKNVLFVIAIVVGVLIWSTAMHAPKASLLLLPLLGWIVFVEHLPRLPYQVNVPLGGSKMLNVELPRYIDGHITITN